MKQATTRLSRLVVCGLLSIGAAHAETARVVSLTGKAWEVSAKKGSAETPLKAGDALGTGDSVRTDANSLLTLKLGNDVAVLLKGDTQARFELKSELDWSLVLANGEVLSAVKNPAKRPNHFMLRTKTATMGVRGTAFFTREKPGVPTYFCACHGTVEVSDFQGKFLRKVTTTHHESPLTLGTPIAPSTEAPNHNDAEIAVLENLLK